MEPREQNLQHSPCSAASWQVPRARALYTYRGHNPGELRFNKGDTIVLLRQLDENWYLGELNGISGVFPASSVQVIKHLPLPRPLYSPEPRGRDRAGSKDILSFPKVPAPGRAPRRCPALGSSGPLPGAPPAPAGTAASQQLPSPPPARGHAGRQSIPRGTQGGRASREGQRR
ncbi:hypothetical protein DV515_00015827 [Chloebia gouldiae]|uniref:SH3 domain-containing protein n=1 Tax=Chloebia gouldiae TaxID=44316 RepID=A0A3L8RVI1_CHLGU|nr:hypothetical protein DV515_00015834 [Chloebia gouldiae]RLV86654.1 hypothetical protein DV515_00015827 [Chloebia gouldiae]